jgi:hypothetical protein
VSNFLDLDAEEEKPEPSKPDLKQLLAQIPVSAPPTRLHPQVSDRLAAQHGFASREPASRFVGGRRTPRGMQVEETRQLSIRMPLSLYNEFLAFADAEKLTYNEAIRTLLDRYSADQSPSGNGA